MSAARKTAASSKPPAPTEDATPGEKTETLTNKTVDEALDNAQREAAEANERWVAAEEKAAANAEAHAAALERIAQLEAQVPTAEPKPTLVEVFTKPGQGWCQHDSWCNTPEPTELLKDICRWCNHPIADHKRHNPAQFVKAEPEQPAA